MAIRRRFSLAGAAVVVLAGVVTTAGVSRVMAAEGQAPSITPAHASLGAVAHRRKAAADLGYGRGYRGYDPETPRYGVVSMNDTGGLSRARRYRGSVNGVPVYIYPLQGDDDEQFEYPDEQASLLDVPIGTSVRGEHCATPVIACLLYGPSDVGRGCSCKVGGGKSRGHVVP